MVVFLALALLDLSLIVAKSAFASASEFLASMSFAVTATSISAACLLMLSASVLKSYASFK